MNKQELYNRINDILLKDWNPIGADVPSDEYEGYVPEIASLKSSGADVEAIAKKLNEFFGKMVNGENAEHSREIAKKIIAIGD